MSQTRNHSVKCGNSGNSVKESIRLLQTVPLANSPLFWRRFAIASVLEEWHVLQDNATWLVRFNQKDYEAACEVISQEANRLQQRLPPENADKTLPCRAAAMLLWLIKEDNYERRARELVPEPDGWDAYLEHTKDLNSSAFQLHRCQVERVLAESNQNVPVLIGRNSQWWADPDLVIPQSFIEKVIAYAEKFDFSDVHASLEKPEEAFAAFTLFLQVADARWPLIIQDLSREGVELSDERHRYVRIRRMDIDKAVKKINDDLQKDFLGKRTSDLLWPWGSNVY